MELIIRADATNELGIGHVMRSLAIAEEWLEYQIGPVYLFGNIESNQLKRFLYNKGIKVFSLINGYRDSDKIISLFYKKEVWVVIDGYGFDNEYIRSLKEAGLNVLFIDDLALPHISAHIFLNYNFYSQELVYDTEAYCLIGPSYSLIRKEFILKRSRKDYFKNRKCYNLMITVGGGDSAGLIPKIVQALAQITEYKFHVKIIIGPVASLDVDNLIKFSGQPHYFSFERAQFSMASIMAWADFAITAGGSTCFELAYMKVPFLVCSIADNQEPTVEWLIKNKFAYPLTGTSQFDIYEMAHAIKIFMNDNSEKQKNASRLAKLVDGKGKWRVVREMLNFSTKDTHDLIKVKGFYNSR